MPKNIAIEEEPKISFEEFKAEILADFKLACESRETSLLGRKEVLTGKAKFGIFGDGKELAQIALAKQFKNGDFRSGYYRDQTFMMAINHLTVKEYFAGLYAETDLKLEPFSGGRQMGGHFATRNLDEKGEWKDLINQKNSSADISPTSGQMSRLLGLAQASKIYRNNKELNGNKKFSKFSNNGNEVAFGMIGDSSTSEGPFWETMNAAAVLQVPMVVSVWDDGYGISVTKKYQTVKESISKALAGFQRNDKEEGIEIFTTKGWDYAHLCKTYEKAVAVARKEHIPVLVHVEEVTQPQGHSTSGSHERYKSKERLQWEIDFDPIQKLKTFILNYKKDGNSIATTEELEEIQKNAKAFVSQEKRAAWSDFRKSIDADKNEAIVLLENLANESNNGPFIKKITDNLKQEKDAGRKLIFHSINEALRLVRGENGTERTNLINWLKQQTAINSERYSSHLYSESKYRLANIEPIAPEYNGDKEVDGRVILRDNFDQLFSKYPEILTFGEDTGVIGGVNQCMEGMQEKYGKLRVSDTGIRENTIIGQAIGMAMRGLRPIAEIQYLDYIMFALQIISDDLATVQYRTKGGQKAPVIIRTRGHRLEGIWHSGSPMGTIINAARGVHICVPRNMTQAAGMYNTLMASDEPALVIESLNGYRIKEKEPSNLGEFKIPLGKVEIVKEGTDVTVVSYGSTFRIVENVAKELEKVGINIELIDIQTLLPFDLDHTIKKSLEKTNRLVIVDEDVPGGASAFILDQILVKQKGYFCLDSEPVTISAKEHRPAYASDGDYFSKPNEDDIFTAIYQLMNEVDDIKFPKLM